MRYRSVDGKLKLLDSILQHNWIEPTETVKLQSLGVTLGDALVQQLGLEWVIVEDEYDRDPALQLIGTSIKCFSLTMISKRIETAETVDVFELFKGLCETI